LTKSPGVSPGFPGGGYEARARRCADITIDDAFAVGLTCFDALAVARAMLRCSFGTGARGVIEFDSAEIRDLGA